jgi:nicotinate-nucleotide--dimethylbenzimidazole phosphoribosyltransferase
VTLLQRTCAAIVPVCRQAAAQARARMDGKTKPRGSLGRLEELACRLASIYRTPAPPLPAKAVIVMAADHGVAEEGVSAYPQEVTAQMVRNFAAGGAALNVLAWQQQAQVIVVDMGTRPEIRDRRSEIGGQGFLTSDLRPLTSEVRSHRMGAGTANITRGPAMSRETALRAMEAGIALAGELRGAGVGLLAVGDMGIANTTAASAMTAAFLGQPPEKVTGRGTGIDDDRLRRKVGAISQALAINRPDPGDAIDVLAKVGGFEIAGLAGVILGAAACKMAVVLDGFITGAAALAAVTLCPASREYLIAAHRSVEPGHAFILRHLDLRPLLDLDMRLGEGTGAVLAMNLIEASLRLLREMATFESAGVADAEA